MTISQAIQQSIYTTRPLRADEAAGNIQLVRAAEASLDGLTSKAASEVRCHGWTKTRLRITR
jgi:hypothetical protein